MKFLIITLACICAAYAVSIPTDYLPPVNENAGAASNVVESNFLESEPAHTLAEDGYRYKTVKRFRLRHRRDVSEITNNYLPPLSDDASSSVPVYSAPASAPAESYAAETIDVPSYSNPSHTLSDDGYRYKTVKRYRYRHRF
ncbi:uncharacterized protein LOC119681396 [Teleopsis dalmanni]|uniref:uncharacterized protein LOC119681396 n=1 Tax=Teleopsis dalmanni TaxID=139649 RepID=UPI0018CD2ADE|nr:uncharacterized protein LOC119681396 [Teleopsis dalmanni]